MKDFIILKKVSEEEMLLERIADTIALVKVAQVLSSVNLAGRYD